MNNIKDNKTEEKIAKVTVRGIPQSPAKLRLVINTIRGMDVEEAITTMQFLNRKGADTVRKALLSGVSNAINKYGVDKKDLVISHMSVDGARGLRKPIYGARGKFALAHKRKSHLNLELKVK